MLTSNGDVTEYGSFYSTSGYATFPQEHRHSVGRYPFSMITVDQGPHTNSDPNVSDTVVCLPLTSTDACSWGWNMGGGGWHREMSVAGRVLVLPAHVDSLWEVSGSRRLLLLIVPARTMREALGQALMGEPSEAFWPLSQATWPDEFLRAVMLRLWEAIAGRDSANGLLADYLLGGALTHLLQCAGTQRARDSTIAIPRWRLRRVTEFAKLHLHEDIGLASLARAAGLSERHFARVFVKATGQTPHRWLMALRLSRAKTLLSEPGLSIVRIAKVCGFAGQAHLTRSLTRQVGITQLRWRHEHMRTDAVG